MSGAASPLETASTPEAFLATSIGTIEYVAGETEVGGTKRWRHRQPGHHQPENQFSLEVRPSNMLHSEKPSILHIACDKSKAPGQDNDEALSEK